MGADGSHRIIAVASDAISGMYRLTIPLRSLIKRGEAIGNVYLGLTLNVELVPDSFVVLQRQLALAPSVVKLLKENRCRIVHDLDDLLWSIPADNPNVTAFTPALLAEMERQIRCADLVTVSTEPLAAAVRARGYDAVVLPNTLEPRDWTVQPRRAPRSRPRIGWYGQRAVHAGDLALIDTVVRQLAGEAQFVFFGDMPAGLGDVAARVERYAAVPLTLFPATLAGLDLDLMLAPLAHSAFNECKSNLRLLQAGMLGYPVVATDIEPHRTLPVTRVPNTPDAWVAAIRERLHDVPALRRDGEALRAAVRAGYAADDWADRYLDAWTGRVAVAARA